MDLFKLVGRFVLDTSNAEAEIDSIIGLLKGAGVTVSQTGDQVSEAGNQMGNAVGKNSKFGAGSVWLGNMLTRASAMCVNFGKNLVKSGFDYNSQMEQLTISFATMMGGDEEAAKALVSQLQELAKVTPMETMGLAKTANLLLGYGTAAEDVIATLTMLGDVAGGNQEKLDSLALAYGQAMASGKLNAQDANQMINAGVPIWSMLAEYMGLTVAEVRDLSSEGEITSDILSDVFKVATSDGGRYYKAMENQSKSYAGQLSTMKDLGDQSKGALMEPFFEVASSNVFPSLSTLLEEFTIWCIENKDQLAELAVTVGDFVVNSLTAILDLFKWITENGEAFNTMLLLLAGGFTAIQIALNPMKGIFLALAEAGLLVMANWDKIKKLWEDITKAIDNAIISLQRFFGINKGSGVEKGSSGVYHGHGGGQFEIAEPNADGSHANGLDRVPRDGYRAILHKDEAVLRASEATVWRNRGMGDTSRLEAKLDSLLSVMNQVVANTGRQQNVYLDKNVLVGQMLPAIDTGLGSYASRKGRRNG